jgi:hypothetical protein
MRRRDEIAQERRRMQEEERGAFPAIAAFLQRYPSDEEVMRSIARRREREWKEKEWLNKGERYYP